MKQGIASLSVFFVVIGVIIIGVWGYFVILNPRPAPVRVYVEVSSSESAMPSPSFVESPAPSPARSVSAKQPIPRQTTVFPIRTQETAFSATPLPAPKVEYPKETEHLSSAPSVLSSSRNAPEFPSAAERSTISDCAGKEFSSAPVDISRLIQISPLGNLAPPGHTFPTEHMFFHISAGGATTDTIPLSVPADVSLTLISFGRGFTQDPVDYTIWFALCKDVIGYFNHVKALSSELEKIVDESSCMFLNESKTTRCNIRTLALVAKGTRIGEVGRLQGNFDMGIIDLRKKHIFANPSRYGARSLYIQCPFEYFNGDIKSRLYGLLSRSDKQCGSVAQDMPGTLKGNWFFGTARADMGSDWDKYLAFADHNEHPGTAVISVGGTFASAGTWEFAPRTSGFVNRAFADVTPDGTIYCYESQTKSGRIAVRLESAMKLFIEYQQGVCVQTPIAFGAPTVYER